MKNTRQTTIIALMGIGLTLLLMGLVPVLFAQDSTPEAAPQQTSTEEAAAATEQAAAETAEPVAAETEAAAATTAEPVAAPAFPYTYNDVTITGDNSYCAVCHNIPWEGITLEDGFILNLYTPPSLIEDSVHGNVGCVDCHGDDAFPHDRPIPTNFRDYRLASVQLCETCHSDQAGELVQGLHYHAIQEGNVAAAVCTDCHGVHDVTPVENQPQLVADICGDCHVTTVSEWRASPHVDIGPLGCSTCHSPHSQNLRAADTANGQCLNCHQETLAANPIWIHVQHQNAQDVSCTNCHMYTGDTTEAIAVGLAIGQLPTGHSMLVETTPCTTCHEQLPEGEAVAQAPDATAEAAAERAETAPTPGFNVTTPVETDVASVEGAQQQADFIQMLQGLILGLGLGATGAAIIVARGNKKN